MITVRPSQMPMVLLSSQSFDDRYIRLPAALAHRLQAVAAARALELVQQRRHQLGSARAERMTERDGAAVHVGAFVRVTRFLQPRHHHRSERLIDLYEVDVLELHTGFG